MTDEARKRRTVAAVLFAALFVLYHLNVSTLDEGDAVPSSNLPIALLSSGRMSFDPDRFPEMFKWQSHPPFIEQDDFFFMSWNDTFGDRTTREWRKDGKLTFNGPRYYVVESPTRHVYVSTFGPIPGLALLPFVAPFYAYDHALSTKMALRSSVAKLGSAAMVAGTAVLLFLIAARRTTRRRALLLALVYGTATCAWAVSSQAIWQQTVNQLLLTWGAYFALGDVTRRRTAALAGLLLGAAMACRATGAIVLALTAVFLFRDGKKSLLPFVLGALPVPLLIAAHNIYYFGSPVSFAQELVGHAIAVQKTGSPKLFQTPLLTGLAGLLVSPSRGLAIFSPVLLPAFVGIYRVLRRDSERALRPFVLSAVLLMLLQCKWFDWWGGHAYGYRPWLDSVPYLVLALLPMLDGMLAAGARRILFGAALAWSVFVQGLGALSYDRFWNLRELFVVRVPERRDPIGMFTAEEAVRFSAAHKGEYLGPSFCDIDYVFCRFRLWSLEDNLIGYQLGHFGETRGRRLPTGYADLERTP